MSETKRIPYAKAAKAVGKSRTWLRDLIEADVIKAWRVGGSDEHPWLEVYLADVQNYLERTIYVPKLKRQPGEKAMRVRPKGKLHPAAENMRHRPRRTRTAVA